MGLRLEMFRGEDCQTAVIYDVVLSLGPMDYFSDIAPIPMEQVDTLHVDLP